MTNEEALEYLDKLRDYIATNGQPRHLKGYEFERRFRELSEERGLAWVRAPGREHYDCVVNGLRVQCKCISPDGRGRICVAPGSGHAYRPGSFDVLAVDLGGRLYMVPEEEIPRIGRTGFLSAAFKVELIFPYENAWWVIERSGRPAGFARQLTLTIGDEEA